MTQREFLTEVSKVLAETHPDLAEFAEGRIEAMNKRNASRVKKPSKVQIENIAIKEKIAEIFEPNTTYLASEIAEKVEISTSKASALLRQMVADEILTSTEVKIKGRKVKSYALA